MAMSGNREWKKPLFGLSGLMAGAYQRRAIRLRPQLMGICSGRRFLAFGPS
jgi:hypothetical protein